MKDIIKNLILENQFADYPAIAARKLKVPLHLNMIVSLIGVRRGGKTYILYDLIKSLQSEGIARERIIFINFEDERLKFNADNLDLILQAYAELHPDIPFKDTYMFFDEIQNIKGWEKFIRRVFDTKTRNLFITGSNSRLLASEIATELRGRTIPFTVYPLSFTEYLDFQGVEKDISLQKNRSKIINLFGKFLHQGGFPEIVFLDEKYRVQLLQQYFNVMIFRDIVERYAVGNVEELKFFIKKIFAGVSKPFSVNKAYNDLKSLGYKISNKYLYEYLSYCNDVFLSLSVNRFDFSEIKQSKTDKKLYIIDTGLLGAIEYSVSKNRGKLLENLFYLETIKRGSEVFYFRNAYECDFIIREGNEYVPVQVAWELEEENTRQREFRGIYEACSYLGVKMGRVITFDQQFELDFKGIKIVAIPAYQIFLRG